MWLSIAVTSNNFATIEIGGLYRLDGESRERKCLPGCRLYAPINRRMSMYMEVVMRFLAQS
jgi:hypothetical protein